MLNPLVHCGQHHRTEPNSTQQTLEMPWEAPNAAHLRGLEFNLHSVLAFANRLEASSEAHRAWQDAQQLEADLQAVQGWHIKARHAALSPNSVASPCW